MKVNAISYLTRPSIMGFELKMAFSAHFVLRNVHVLYTAKKGLIISALFFLLTSRWTYMSSTRTTMMVMSNTDVRMSRTTGLCI